MISDINMEAHSIDHPLIMEMLNFEQRLSETFTLLELQLAEKKSTTLSNIATLISDNKIHLSANSKETDSVATVIWESSQPEETLYENTTCNRIMNNLEIYQDNMITAINQIDTLLNLYHKRWNNFLYSSPIEEIGKCELISQEGWNTDSKNDIDIASSHSALSYPKTNTTRKKSLNISSLPKHSKFCTVCGKYVSCLTRHMKMPGENPYSCVLCSKTFASCGAVKTHMKIHTGEKSYSCVLCTKAFLNKSGLDNHMRIHSGEKPYSCVLCGKSFSQSSSLKTHLRIHTGEKPYSCELCGRSFSYSYSLRNHAKSCA